MPITDDIFEHTLNYSPIITLRVKKQQIVDILEKRLGRVLTSEESDKAWIEIQSQDDWHLIFPGANPGICYLGASDYEFYYEVFKGIVDLTIEEHFKAVLEDCLSGGFDEVEAMLRDETPEITLANLEHCTKKQIQDDNVRNGLAFCANETKEKSIRKWKENYLKKHLNIDPDMLPQGKTVDEFCAHILKFLNSGGSA